MDHCFVSDQLNNVTTLTSPNSDHLRRRFVMRTMRRFARSATPAEQSMIPSRNATHQLRR